MLKIELHKYQSVALVKAIATTLSLMLNVAFLVLWLRWEPQVILVGLDEAGPRLITSDQDKLLQAELRGFLSRYVYYAYNYDANNAEDQFKAAGNFLSTEAWALHSPEFQSIAKRLKTSPLNQSTAVKTDFDRAPDGTYSAIVEFSIRTASQEVKARRKIHFTVSPKARSAQGPEGPEAYELTAVREEDV